MASPTLAALISSVVQNFNDSLNSALSTTPADAAAVSEAPGLVSDPVLGPGAASLAALKLAWKLFFEGNFEVTGHQKILMVQQANDLNRAKGFVEALRLRVQVQDAPVFNLNPVA